MKLLTWMGEFLPRGNEDNKEVATPLLQICVGNLVKKKQKKPTLMNFEDDRKFLDLQYTWLLLQNGLNWLIVCQAVCFGMGVLSVFKEPGIILISLVKN